MFAFFKKVQKNSNVQMHRNVQGEICSEKFMTDEKKSPSNRKTLK